MDDWWLTCRKLGKSYFSASKLPYVCHCGNPFCYSSLKGCVSFVTRGVMDLLGMHDTDGPFQGQLDQLKSKMGVYIGFCGFSCWCSENLKRRPRNNPFWVEWVTSDSKPFKLNSRTSKKKGWCNVNMSSWVATLLPCFAWGFLHVVASMAGWDPDEWSDL